MRLADEAAPAHDGDSPAPANMGRMNDPDGAAWITGLCGDSMEMYLVVGDGKITQARFYTEGCAASRACGSAAAELAEGRTLEDALRVSPADVLDTWGTIPKGNVHCAILAVNALHKALADYMLRSQNG
jgi:nitrogen fixation NifU-like protein